MSAAPLFAAIAAQEFAGFYHRSVAKKPPFSYNVCCEVRAVYELDKGVFGAHVAELRKEKNFTQKELARKLFVSDKAVSKWERGLSLPDTALLVPLADALGVTVTDLLLCGKISEKSVPPEQVEELLRTTAKLSHNGKQHGKWNSFLPDHLLTLILEVAFWLLYTGVELFAVRMIGNQLSIMGENLLFLVGVLLNLVILVPLAVLSAEKLSRWIGWHLR